MSDPADAPSALQRAIDIAGSIAGAALPKRAAIGASANDVLDLARAVASLDTIAQAAADFIACTEEEAPAATERLVGLLGAAGFLTIIDTEESTNGNAD